MEGKEEGEKEEAGEKEEELSHGAFFSGPLVFLGFIFCSKV